MSHRIEFDGKQKILRIAFDGDVTEASFLEAISAVIEFLKKIQILGRVTDFTNAGQVLLSGEFLRKLAMSDLFEPNAAEINRVIIAPQPATFGLARMFQMYRESSGNAPKVVRDMDEALRALGVASVHFRPVK